MMETGWLVLKVVVLLGLLLGFGQPVLRAWFRIVAQRKTSELFMLNVLLVTLLLAWLCHIAGCRMRWARSSQACSSPKPVQAPGSDDIGPFRDDVLLGMFFISVGMQLDGGLVLQQLGWVALTVVLLIGGKVMVLQPLASGSA